MEAPEADNCCGAFHADEWIGITSNAFGIVFILIVGCYSYRKIQSDEEYKMNLLLEILYFTTIFTACIILSGSFLSLATCLTHSVAIQYIYGVELALVWHGYIVICSTLLGSLIIRLYITFLNSHWNIPKKKVILALMVLLFVDIFWIVSGVALLFEWIELKDFYLAAFIGLIIYILDSCWAVYHFARNLISLAKMRTATKLSMQLQLQPELSERPQKMIGISSKYVALFMMASITTTVTFMMAVYFRIVLMIHPGILYTIDCVVNTVCLYLYHNFAAHHYDRYCSGLDGCCRWRMVKNVKMDFITRKKIMSIAEKKADDTSNVAVGDESPVLPTSSTPESQCSANDLRGDRDDEKRDVETALERNNSQSTAV